MRAHIVISIVFVGCTARGTVGEEIADSEGEGTTHSGDTAHRDSDADVVGSGLAEGMSGDGEVGGYEEDGGADGCAFACPMPGSGGTVFNECDVWAQDCPRDQKCMPWANDGGGAWNATRCSPLDPNAANVGDPCIVEGSGVSGIDNCARRSMCWNVDNETNGGTCVPFCIGTEASHGCEDPTLTCVVANEGVLNLCLPSCDPLQPNCVAGEGCYPIEGSLVCSPDASGDAGAYGDACEFLNVCDPGLHCVALGTPECPSGSCCSEFCDLDDPDATCPDADVGQACVPLFELGQAPPGLQHIGSCAMPE